ncbi:MAG: PH domain-containing protein [Planctomycetota bacterium]
MTRSREVLRAEFHPQTCDYWLLTGSLILAATIFGIPLLLLWIPLGLAVTRRYLASCECVLTERELLVNKGIWFRTEKTIPLEKITDLGMSQGPVMRHFGIEQLTVETAGASGPGALVTLVGVVDAPAFREAVLTQRDAAPGAPALPGPAADPGPADRALLAEILTTLTRIDGRLEQIAASADGGERREDGSR